jgi:hypothetical protein
MRVSNERLVELSGLPPIEPTTEEVLNLCDDLQEARAALLAAYKWRGLDGDGISQPELGQIERALGLEESK